MKMGPKTKCNRFDHEQPPIRSRMEEGSKYLSVVFENTYLVAFEVVEFLENQLLP